jgi:hypothetical protein
MFFGAAVQAALFFSSNIASLPSWQEILFLRRNPNESKVPNLHAAIWVKLLPGHTQASAHSLTSETKSFG